MKKFKKRRRKLHTRKVFLLNSILVVFLFLGIGYSLLSTELTIDGDVIAKKYYEPTLYNVLKKETETGGLAREYTGEHQDSMNASLSTEKIYHWYANNSNEGTAILDKYNVIFAGHCWQMIRTTDTGGVKMIYNGETENNQCLNTRGNHIGYTSRTSQNLASNYWYGTDYTYDSTNQVFQIAGTTEQATWNATTGPGLIGKYTCKNTNENGTCSTLYLVESYYNTTSAYVIPLNSNSHYSQFGTLPFNANYTSPADVGYMYNTRYEHNSKNMTETETMLSNSSLATTYWYADTIDYGILTANRYSLVSPYQVSSTYDYPNLVGKYTFRSSNQTNTSTSVYYIAAVNGSTMYYIQLGNSTNHNLTDFNYTYTYGDSFTDNGNGTYTINNPTTINRSDWYTSYSSVGANKYVCKNAVNDTCSELWYTTATAASSMKYIKVENNYKYAKEFTWDGSKYVLDNDTSVIFWNINDSTNNNSLNNAHYTCWNTTGECTTLSYIYYVAGSTPFYVNLTSGKSIEEAKNEMLYDDNVNTTNSTIKSGVDAWYKQYLSDYSDYLEDTIFCNDRSQINQSNNGWNPNGGSINNDLAFKGWKKSNLSLSCTNTTDRFSITNSNATLTYKVGIMTSQEMNILNNSKARNTGQSYWLASPSYFYDKAVNLVMIGVQDNEIVNSTKGVRPSISLKPETRYSSGDGSMANPYIVDVEAHHYVYSTSEEKTKGVLVSELGSTYQAEIDALNGFGKRVFLKHKIENDRVVSSGVTFQRNGIMYNLIGEGATYNESTGEYNEDSIYYDDNKQTLKEAFGEENCTEYTTPEKYYECTDGSELGAVRASGRVGVEINQWYCRDFQDGTFHCREY